MLTSKMKKGDKARRMYLISAKRPFARGGFERDCGTVKQLVASWQPAGIVPTYSTWAVSVCNCRDAVYFLSTCLQSRRLSQTPLDCNRGMALSLYLFVGTSCFLPFNSLRDFLI